MRHTRWGFWTRFRVEMTPDMLFQTGSITKVRVRTLLMS
jgi:hypothetical protein